MLEPGLHTGLVERFLDRLYVDTLLGRSPSLIHPSLHRVCMPCILRSQQRMATALPAPTASGSQSTPECRRMKGNLHESFGRLAPLDLADV